MLYVLQIRKELLNLVHNLKAKQMNTIVKKYENEIREQIFNALLKYGEAHFMIENDEVYFDYDQENNILMLWEGDNQITDLNPILDDLYDIVEELKKEI